MAFASYCSHKAKGKSREREREGQGEGEKQTKREKEGRDREEEEEYNILRSVRVFREGRARQWRRDQHTIITLLPH